MKLLTEVDLPAYPFRLDHQTPVLLLGSCFTENMGRQLQKYLFPVCVNPFGVTYNPLSVKRSLEALMHKEVYTPDDLDEFNGLWFSFDHYTGFSSPDREQTLEQINRSFVSARKVLEKAGVLILTWGTSWVYHYKRTGEVVCNCHRIPAREFTRRRLDASEIHEAYVSLLDQLFEFNDRLKVIHTVSPVRHWKDGAHGNQLSKAALLLAGDSLQEQYPEKFFYFPSYEIVMDELRDYRFYAEDMIHTSAQTTAYIWEKFRQVLVSESSGEFIRDLDPLLKIKGHRPRGDKNGLQENRMELLETKLAKLRSKYPGIPLDNFLKDIF